MAALDKERKERIEFQSGFGGAFRYQIHSDMALIPGDNGAPLPTHRVVMATRSKVFKNMLDSDICMATPAGAVMLPEMSSGELEAFLEFLYEGRLSAKCMARHVYSLTAAADKYDVPFLRCSCERYMRETLSVSTALDVLVTADTCSLQALKDAAVKFIVANMEQIIFSRKYEAFALENPHLCVLIARASFKVQQSVKSQRKGEDHGAEAAIALGLGFGFMFLGTFGFLMIVINLK